MKKKNGETMNRCQEGWRLFHMMGDSFEYQSRQKSPAWERHDEIVREYEEHISVCTICKKGKNGLQMTFEEMTVEDVRSIG